MQDREKIEELLQNYRSIRSEIEIELNRKYPEYSLDSVSFVKTEGKTSGHQSEVESYVVDKYSLDDETEKKVQVAQIIRAAYLSLTSEQRAIVRRYYFEDDSIKETARHVGWSRDTIYRRLREIVRDLRREGILKAWEIWKGVRV